MSRPRIQSRDAEFWNSVRSLLDQAKAASEQNWTEIATELGVSKQRLTGFRKGRIDALDAEAVLRLCSRCNLTLRFEGRIIGSFNPALRLTMEFDEDFEIAMMPTPSAVLTRKPPGRVSYIGVRVEQVVGGLKE